jgi:hypothetical protein
LSRTEAAGTQRVLIFLHNMRTAGETLRTLIARQYDQQEVCTVLGKPESASNIPEIQEADLEKIKVVQGHIPFGVHEAVRRPARYVSLLREPIDRVISLYYHILENPKLGYHRMAREHLSSLSAFVASGTFSELDNGQTRRLSGVYPKFGRCSDDMLERAKHNLMSHFVVVGTTERFDESLLLMKGALGWRHIFYHKINVAKTRPSRESISADALELIERHNTLDTELFHYAEQLLQQAIDRQGVDFQRELESFKLANAELAKWAAHLSKEPDRGRRGSLETVPLPTTDHGLPTQLLEAHAYFLSREAGLLQDRLRLRRREARLAREKAGLKKKLRRARSLIRQMQSTRVWRLGAWCRNSSTRLRTMLHL